MACQTDVTTPLHPCSELCKAAAMLDPSSAVAPCCLDGGVSMPGDALAPAANCCQGGAAGGAGQCVANVGRDKTLQLGLQPPLHDLLLVEAK
ncbi:hypothetical protein HaLaN_31085, partial [Haematococcus lacustris]